MSLKKAQAEPETLERLLAKMREELSQDPRYNQEHASARIKDLARTANSIAKYLGKTRDTIAVSELVGIEAGFRQYLEGSGGENNTIASILSRLRALVRAARKFGWAPHLFALENDWEPIWQSVRGVQGGPAIVKDALAHKIPVSHYSDADFDDWGERRVAKGVSKKTVRAGQSEFCRVLRTSGLSKHFPLLNVRVRRKSSIRLPLDEMPPSLREEIEAILHWMRGEAERNAIRMKTSREKAILTCFEEFVGYGVHAKKMTPPTQLVSLLTSEYIHAYVLWLECRGRCQKEAILHQLAPIRHVLRSYDPFTGLGPDPCRKALRQIGPDKESERTERRRARQVDHGELVRLTRELGRKRATGTGLSPEARAWLCHDELLMLLLTWYPWYPHCLCTCRFTGPSPNLFRGPVPEDGRPFALTEKAKAELEADPKAEFWQFSFSADEAPNGSPASGLMPNFFVPILNEYRASHLLLTKTTGAETLFLTRKGRPISAPAMRETIGDLTPKRWNRHITPTACRGIFAYYWLEEYPDDYENLAQILWMSIPVAKRTYDLDWKSEDHWKDKKSA